MNWNITASQRGYEFSENNQVLYIPHFNAKKDDGVYNCNAAQYSSFETLSINVTGYGEAFSHIINWISENIYIINPILPNRFEYVLILQISQISLWSIPTH